MIIYQKRIFREDLRANPEVLYVFGDNNLRIGMGGQAYEMRGEPNAVGIRTKHGPSMAEGSFFTDATLEQNIEMIKEDHLHVVQHELFFTGKGKGIVICPLDGIGTGLAEMPQRCPLTFEYLKKIGLA